MDETFVATTEVAGLGLKVSLRHWATLPTKFRYSISISDKDGETREVGAPETWQEAVDLYARHIKATLEVVRPYVPAPKPAKAGRRQIKVSYRAVDGARMNRNFLSLEKAQAFAQKYVGSHPEIGGYYAVSGDGIGKVTCEGCSLAELFPSAETETREALTYGDHYD
jgi:hypothetical protein